MFLDRASPRTGHSSGHYVYDAYTDGGAVGTAHATHGQPARHAHGRRAGGPETSPQQAGGWPFQMKSRGGRFDQGTLVRLIIANMSGQALEPQPITHSQSRNTSTKVGHGLKKWTRSFMTTSFNPGTSMVIASFLVPEVVDTARHVGSFETMVGQVVHTDHDEATNTVPRMFRAVDFLLRKSTGLCCAGVFLHVIHNLASLEDGHIHRNVTYHSFPARQRTVPLPLMPMNDLRFILMDSLLERMAWDCAYSIDLTDVDVMRVPACRQLPPDRLVIGTDTCGMRSWLVKRAELIGLNESWEREAAGFRSFLQSTGKSNCPKNTGVIGGRREVFIPALRSVAHRLRKLWERPPREVAAGADMVVWNELAFKRGDRALITGYPLGPVNLPSRVVPTPTARSASAAMQVAHGRYSLVQRPNCAVYGYGSDWSRYGGLNHTTRGLFCACQRPQSEPAPTRSPHDRVSDPRRLS
jgi:hypothetical protein